MSSVITNIPELSTKALSKNAKVIDNARSSLAAVAGFCAGIVGLQGWLNGIIFYIAISTLLSFLIWALMTKCNSPKHFTSWQGIWIDGVFGNMFSFLLFWTFAYGLVYVYE